MKNKKNRFSLTIKTTIMVIAMSIILCLTIFFISGKIIKDIIIEQYSRMSIELTSTVAATVDAEKIEHMRDVIMERYNNMENKVRNDEWGTTEWQEYVNQYKDIEEMDDFVSIRNHLKTMQDASNVECLYIVYIDKPTKATVYLVDATDFDNEDYCPPGCFDPIYLEEDGIEDMFKTIDDGVEPNITKTDEHGWLIATSKPIFNKNNEIIGFAAADYLMTDIMAQRNRFWLITGIVLLALALLFSVVAILIVNKQIIHPIRLLSQTARIKQEKDETKIAYNFQNLNIKTHDEIEELSDSMTEMETEINKHIVELMETKTQLSVMSEMANKDVLTGVRNKHAYTDETEKLTQEIKAGTAEFGIAMIDLNYLKTINDNYGHDKGDIAIQNVCNIICDVFKHSPVFRIGGDEFTVILKNQDYNNIENLTKEFGKKIKEAVEKEGVEPWEKSSAAIGYAFYDKKIDVYVEDVFKRADREMYREKEKMKSEN